MTIRTSGPTTFGAGDFHRTDQGITWGIKCVSISRIEAVSICTMLPDGTWTIEEHIDDGFDMSAGRYPQVIDWFTNVLLPKLNAWLAARFPARVGGAESPAPAPVLTRLEQADALINTRLRITVGANGTLTAGLEP